MLKGTSYRGNRNIPSLSSQRQCNSFVLHADKLVAKLDHEAIIHVTEWQGGWGGVGFGGHKVCSSQYQNFFLPSKIMCTCLCAKCKTECK